MMSRSPTRDLLAGVFVIAGIVALAFLAFRVGDDPFSEPGGLLLYATFDETGGLKVRAPVDIAGVRVGRVSSITLDEEFRARVELDVELGLELPIDSSASIVTAGLLGDRHVSLQLGGEDQILQDGEEIGFTESALVMERLLGKLVHNIGAGSSD